MTVLAVLGGQWGDEGKGKIIDHLAEKFEIVARCRGGHNAGHTVKIGDKEYPFHLIPSGILRTGKTCVIGNGVVIEPSTLLEEIRKLEGEGIDAAGRLLISGNAHVIFPYHSKIDVAREERRGKNKIGTTSRGIGPAYEDKVSRIGLRVCELLDDSHLEERVDEILAAKNEYLTRIFGMNGFERESILESLRRFREKVGGCVTNTSAWLNEKIKGGGKVLLEGAQGTLLDIDHGTYPFVTSSNSSVGGVIGGSGIGPTRIDHVLLVLKAYCTRVGEGPFPTEQAGPVGDKLRERGKEYGTTTGRPRRCGWFDAVAAAYSVNLNGASSVALTLLDVLDEFEEVKIGVSYNYKGKRLAHFPAEPWVLRDCEVEYETMEGWRTDLSGISRMEELPEKAIAYVRRVEELVGAPVSVVSVGPERTQLIVDGKGDLLKLIA